MRRLSKMQERHHRIRGLLSKTDMGFGELLRELKVSGATLSKDITILLGSGEITSYKDKKDRRIEMYRLNEDKANPEIHKFNILKFIDAIENPKFATMKGHYGEVDFLTAGFSDMKDISEKQLKNSLQMLNRVFGVFLKVSRLKDKFKLAYVILLEKE